MISALKQLVFNTKFQFGEPFSGCKSLCCCFKTVKVFLTISTNRNKYIKLTSFIFTPAGTGKTLVLPAGYQSTSWPFLWCWIQWKQNLGTHLLPRGKKWHGGVNVVRFIDWRNDRRGNLPACRSLPHPDLAARLSLYWASELRSLS